MGEFLRGALRDLPFFVAGVDEGKILLAVIVKSERPVVGDVFHLVLLVNRVVNALLRRYLIWLIGQQLLPGDVILHALRRFQRYALAGAQPAAQLAVVYRLAPKSGLGDADSAAIALDL